MFVVDIINNGVTGLFTLKSTERMTKAGSTSMEEFPLGNDDDDLLSR